ncbi:MAG: type III pantothenate kinase [Cryomorphaceae bacterium]|nr:type III pantothenate kinase [Cryomorphaceae bacterium]
MKKNIQCVLDLGNTRTKVGVFQNGTLISHQFFPANTSLSNHLPPGETPCIMSNVRTENHPQVIEIRNHFGNLLQLNHESRLPIILKVDHPKTVGADRIALCAGALDESQHPDGNKLIISTGTCITYNYIENGNTFIGGAISPGYQMRLNAMHEQTGKLPKIEADFEPIHEISTFTEGNLASGVFFGIHDEIEGRILRFLKQYPGGEIFLTGGHHLRLVNTRKYSIFANPNLLLIGLQKILDFNT